jgi:hypothetical protein
MTFSDVVESVKELSTSEKREIQMLLTQYLREERRQEIYENFISSQNEELKFSANIGDLKKMIEE